MSGSCLVWWREYFEELADTVLWDRHHPHDRISLLAVYIPIIRGQLRNWVDQWNAHHIGVQYYRPHIVTGQPFVNFFFPEDGTEDYGVPVPQDVFEGLHSEAEAFALDAYLPGETQEYCDRCLHEINPVFSELQGDEYDPRGHPLHKEAYLCLGQAINHEFLIGNGHILAELDPPEGGYHWRPAINIGNRQISTEISRRAGVLMTWNQLSRSLTSYIQMQMITDPISSAVQGPTAQFHLELNVCCFIGNPRTPIGHPWMKLQVVGDITKVVMRDEFLRAQDGFTTEEVWVRRLLQQVPSQHPEVFFSYESKRAAQLRIFDDFTGPNKGDPSYFGDAFFPQGGTSFTEFMRMGYRYTAVATGKLPKNQPFIKVAVLYCEQDTFEHESQDSLTFQFSRSPSKRPFKIEPSPTPAPRRFVRPKKEKKTIKKQASANPNTPTFSVGERLIFKVEPSTPPP